MKRTSAQPEVNLRLLHSNALKLQPLVRGAIPLPAPHPFLQAGFWTDIQRRRERLSLELGYLLHGHTGRKPRIYPFMVLR
jgi:hypothetical protein